METYIRLAVRRKPFLPVILVLAHFIQVLPLEILDFLPAVLLVCLVISPDCLCTQTETGRRKM